MQIEIQTSCYNTRHYGKPWVALVDFSDPKGAFEFGRWVGAPGEPGRLLIDAEPGDVVATGQKDFRRGDRSAPDYHIVQADGLSYKVTKVEAFDAWQAKHAAPAAEPAAAATDLTGVSTEALLAELARRNVNA